MLVKTIILGSFFILTSLTNNHLDAVHEKNCKTITVNETGHVVIPETLNIVPAIIYNDEIIPSVMLNEVVITPEREDGTLVKATRVGDEFVPTVMLDQVIIKPII